MGNAAAGGLEQEPAEGREARTSVSTAPGMSDPALQKKQPAPPKLPMPSEEELEERFNVVLTDGAFSDSGFDHSFFAETARKGSVVSRANSIGSTSASSVPNTDDEDSDYRQETSYKDSYKDRRRQAHTQAEQKRRDAIKKGYEDLQSIVPTCQQQSEFAVGAQKISKATVLQKTIDYIHFLHKEKKKQEEEVTVLRKEVMALKIMKTNYEHIVKAHQNNPQQGEDQVSDQVKFNIFQSIMDSLFQSFSNSVSVSSFQELSACVFSWIEEHCKPQTLREFVVGVLRQLNSQLY